ncbi:alpha/beta hydrolase [Terrimonas pollutisoli]|uniref:alpha/beta hydrolase n=1 Tax=Terrimonas pollutisoli TaxID=3034147 RepID=UPI0023EE2510|nr:alpha/beta fold hydrolase [Terrimonas sp. H1YJ31]
MKKLAVIPIICLTLAGLAQESCLPKYNTPVKTIQLSSGKMAYIEKGKGKTILFIHGLGGNISHWEKAINELSSSYQCIAVDLPGYGWSDMQVDTRGRDRLQFYADVLGEFLKKKKIKSVVLTGHSMGGQVATIMSLQNKRVKKLVLVAPAGLETFTEKEAKLLSGVATPAALENQDETVIRNNFNVNFFRQPAEVESLIQDRLRMKACDIYKIYCENVAAGVTGMLIHPVRDSLQYLSMPVLVVFGANDALITNRYLHPALKTDELALQSAASIKNSKVEMIPQAGHMVQFEKSNEVTSIIKNFAH